MRSLPLNPPSFSADATLRSLGFETGAPGINLLLVREGAGLPFLVRIGLERRARGPVTHVVGSGRPELTSAWYEGLGSGDGDGVRVLDAGSMPESVEGTLILEGSAPSLGAWAARSPGAEVWWAAALPRGFEIGDPLPPEWAPQTGPWLALEPATGRLVRGDRPQLEVQLDFGTLTTAPPGLPSSGFCLLSGGASGTEAEAGACAERWGLEEACFSFAGRAASRSRGLVELDPEALERGRVSPGEASAQLHRTLPKTSELGRLLASIWHQIASAGEVIAFGLLLPDGTVKGGTGWGVELARSLGKSVRVYDVDARTWHEWSDGRWSPIAAPRIRSVRFAVTGTRYLSEECRDAIHGLFSRSFGAGSR